jgi:hypothetical protein
MISQEGFDEMVLENMEEFEMTREDALGETIQQLRSMGKDLSSIDTTGGEIRKEILKHITDLNENILNKVEVLCALQELLFKKEYSEKNQNIFRGNGGVIALLRLIDPMTEANILRTTLEFLLNISKNNGWNLHMTYLCLIFCSQFKQEISSNQVVQRSCVV